MNLIELLIESRKLINHCIGKFQMGETELYNAEKLRDNIEDALTEPAPDAMELACTIEKIFDDAICDVDDYHDNYVPVMSRARAKAAALIESRRVVPRAMLDEIADESLMFRSKEDQRVKVTAIAAKHGYKVEG